MLNDGTTTYVYNHANRLVAVSSAAYNATFLHNGLGDRLSETVGGAAKVFVLDINTGLTQVLSDGGNAYLYGLGRIAQMTATSESYFLGDALGSVRQLTDANGNVTLARSYEPYGSVLSTAGASSTAYGFTGEWTDGGLVFLRARYYSLYSKCNYSRVDILDSTTGQRV